MPRPSPDPSLGQSVYEARQRGELWKQIEYTHGRCRTRLWMLMRQYEKSVHEQGNVMDADMERIDLIRP